MKKAFLVLLCLLATACQPVVKPVSDGGNMQRQLAREALLRKQSDWSFRGRAAISDGRQAGTVKMFWRQNGDLFDIEISLPVSNQTYRLRNFGGKARLESHGFETIVGDDAEAVLMQVTGWRIPFGDMQMWLRGIRTKVDTPVEFNPDGLPTRFLENGWWVDYRAWNAAPTPMPTKVFASSGSGDKKASVRLQIDAWDAP